MNVASIDIGTNTVLLLIAKITPDNKNIIPLQNEYRMPRIGKGLIEDKRISDESVKKLLIVLNEYSQIIHKHNCEKTFVTATNALRIASNKSEILHLIKNRFQFSVDVITGEREAEYAYLGAVSGINKNKTALVIDIGGGSTELIYGKANHIKYKRSFNIGSVSATESFLKKSPPANNSINLFNKYLKSFFSEIKNKFQCDVFLAIAGTATTLACMQKGFKEFQEKDIESSYLSREDLKSLIETITPMSAKQIRNTYGPVMEGREDIILAGGIILYQLMALLEAKEIMISSRGIRYGAIYYNLKNVFTD